MKFRKTSLNLLVEIKSRKIFITDQWKSPDNKTYVIYDGIANEKKTFIQNNKLILR
jgi:hypothetical protein